MALEILALKNICWLLNLIHRLHCAGSSAWASWIRQRADIANLRCDNLGQHWELLRSLFPLYQALTTVQIRDGKTTLFWSDVWIGDEALADRFPRLFSHCSLKDSSVQQAIESNLGGGAFVNRLSSQAQSELSELNAIVHQTTLSDQHDKRMSPFSRTPDKLDTAAIYRLLKDKGQGCDPASSFIWRNAAPPRVQMFLWLLIKGRIQCARNLFHKKIVDSPICTVCSTGDETPDHIIFHCPFASQFWSALGLQAGHNFQTRQLHCIQKLPNLPDDQYSAFISLCCWQLWKRRNGAVFRDERLNLRILLLSCKAEASQWKARMPKKSKNVSEAWCAYFDQAMNDLRNVI